LLRSAFVRSSTPGNGEPQHAERDRDREDTVAERDDAVELDLGLIAVAGAAAGDRIEPLALGGLIHSHDARYVRGRRNPACGS
jgi:hypothetical protein